MNPLSLPIDFTAEWPWKLARRRCCTPTSPPSSPSTPLISLSPSLPLSLSVFRLSLFTLSAHLRPTKTHELRQVNDDTRGMRSFRRCRTVGTQLHSPWKAIVAGDGGMWIDREKMPLIHCLQRVLTAILGSIRFNSSPLVVMVPSVRDESGRIYNHTFRDKLSKL